MTDVDLNVERPCPTCGTACVTDQVDVSGLGKPPGSEFIPGNARCPEGCWDLQREIQTRTRP